MLREVTLSVAFFIVMLSVIILNVVMLCVIMLIAVALFNCLGSFGGPVTKLFFTAVAKEPR